MRAKFLKELASLGLPLGPGPEAVVTEADLAALPESAQRYLRFMSVVGRPRDWSLRFGWVGRFRPKLDGGWMNCEAWQYNTSLDVARVFHIRIRFGSLVPVLARDTYVRGRGRMLIRALDLFTVEDATGPELDIGELVTYLNDAVLLAPSMLLGPATTWSPVDESSFDVAVTDRGRTVTGRVFLDERGAPRDFSTTDRFCKDPDDPTRGWVRTQWTTPVEGWEMVNGRPLPTRGQAVWHLPEGPFPYADFRIASGTLAYNVRPGV